MSSLLAFVASDVAQILLGGCSGVGMVLAAASSITISILGATMVIRTSSIVSVSSMVMGISSRVRGKMRLLLTS